MDNQEFEGMVVAGDGRHAVMVDPKNGHYGWVFFKHPDGGWVSLRKASGAEFKAAQRQNDFHLSFISGPYVSADCAVPPKAEAVSTGPTAAAFEAVLADHNRLVRELDVLLNGEIGAADQASLCDIVAQVRMARKKPGTGSLQLLALVPDQVVGRVHHNPDHHDQVRAVLNECGRALPDNAPLYARPADTVMRYVRAPSRKDPKYHEEWPEIEGGPVFDGVTYCKDLFEALKRFNVIVAETMPEDAVDG